MSFAVSKGVRIIDGALKIDFFVGASDPSVVGKVAPIGSVYDRTNGITYKKTGTGNMDWQPYSEIEGGGLLWESAVSTTAAVAGKGYSLNSSGGAFIVTLPASPELGDMIGFVDGGGVLSTNNVTINRNGSLINAIADNPIIDINFCDFTMMYTGPTVGWVFSNTDESGNLNSIKFFVGSADNVDPSTTEYSGHTTESAVHHVHNGDDLETGIALLDQAVVDTNNFIGKSDTLNEMPAYSTQHYVANLDPLETAIGKLDTALNSVSSIASAGVNWRPFIMGATSDSRLNGNIPAIMTAGHFSDDDAPFWVFSSDASIGDRVVYIGSDAAIRGHIFEYNGTTWTDVDSLSPNHAVAVHYDFNDTIGSQEDGAAYMMNSAGNAVIKIADFDLETAATIGMSGGYTPTTGNVTSSDSIESAIQKLDANLDNHDATLGISQGAVSLGTAGLSKVANDSTVKAAIIALDTAVVANETNINSNDTELNNIRTFTGASGPTDVAPTYSTNNYVTNGDSLETAIGKIDTAIKTSIMPQVSMTIPAGSVDVPVDSLLQATTMGAEWFIIAYDGAGNRSISKFIGIHDGGTNKDSTEYGILQVGSDLLLSFNITANATNMVLTVSSANGSDVNIIVKRLEITI